MRRKVALILISTVLIIISLVSSFNGPSAEAKTPSKVGHWIGAWSASQVAAWDTVDWDGGTSLKGFDSQTLRMIVHPNASGSAVRIRLSNELASSH